MDMDYLTCGQCLKEFPLQKITSFIQHKKLSCDDDTGTLFQETDLKCYYCPRGFMSAWGLLVHVQLTHSLQIFVDHKTPPSLSTHANTDSWSSQIKPTVKENASPRENNKSGVYDLFSSTSKVTVEENEESLHVEKCKKTNILKNDNCPHEAERKTAAQKVLLYDEMFEKDGKNDSSVLESSNLALCGSSTEITGSIDKGVSLRSITRTILMENVTTNPSRDIDKVVNVMQSHKMVKPVTLLSKLSAPVMTVGEKDSIPAGNNMSVMQHCIPQPAAAQNIMQDGPKSLPASESSLKFLPSESQGPPEAGGKENAECSDNIGSSEDTDMGECCDDQGCGITVIPGSHQDLQKCCNAVVPKKRKRHMEMKHMPFSWSSSRYARRRMLQRSLASVSKSTPVNYVGQPTTATSTILIDVEPGTLGHIDKNPNTDNQQGTTGESLLNDTQSNSKNLAAIPVNVFPGGSESRTKSLILQPGAVFSIPFSYNVPSSGKAASIPISIIQAQSNHCQDDSSSVAFGKLVPIGTANKDESQQQVSRSGDQGNAEAQGEISVGEVDLRRRKYPTSKPFQCDKCSMAFNQRIHLKKHMSKHTGIKPYKCNECDYSTVERSHLKVHIRIHTGEKPFKCTYCEYATAQNSTLKIHLKRHHGGKMFSCQSCDKSFTQIEQLKDHESEHCLTITGTTPQKKKVTGTDNKLAIDDVEKSSEETNQVGTDHNNMDLQQKNNKDDLGHVLSIPEKH